jgi:hypothetical protein
MEKRKELLIAVSVCVGGYLVWSKLFGAQPMSYKDLVLLDPVVMPLVKVFTEKENRKRRKAKPFELSPSFESGLYGGLIGGACAGLIIGVTYCFDLFSSDLAFALSFTFQILGFAALVGIITGTSIQLAILLFRYLAHQGRYPSFAFNEIVGGVVGGAIGGLLAGAMAGWWFGLRDEPPVNVDVLVGSAVFGSFFVVLGVLLYDYNGQLSNLRSVWLVLLGVSSSLFVVGIYAVEYLGVNEMFFFEWETNRDALEGGGTLGSVIGAVLGLQIGLSLFLHRIRSMSAKVSNQ